MSAKSESSGPGCFTSIFVGTLLFGVVLWALGYTPQQAILWGFGAASSMICLLPTVLVILFVAFVMGASFLTNRWE